MHETSVRIKRTIFAWVCKRTILAFVQNEQTIFAYEELTNHIYKRYYYRAFDTNQRTHVIIVQNEPKTENGKRTEKDKRTDEKRKTHVKMGNFDESGTVQCVAMVFFFFGAIIRNIIKY